MRRTVSWIAVVLALAACDGPSAPTTPEASTPDEVHVPAAAPERRARAGETAPASAALGDVALGRVEGLVLAGAGEALVADFPVFLLGDFGADDLPLAETRTDAAGAFSFDGVPAGRARVVAVGPRGGAERRAEAKVEVAANARATARLRLTEHADDGFVVTGVVQWADTGAPVKSFSFSLWGHGAGVRGRATEVRGTDGRFRVAVPLAGQWRVNGITADGVRITEFDAQFVVPAADGVVLSVPRPGEGALVVVDAATGAPLPSARAHRSRHTYETGHELPDADALASPARKASPDGRIALGDGAGSAYWYVTADGHEWFCVKAPYGQSFEVRLRPGGALRVSIPRWEELDSATVDLDEEGSRGRLELPAPDANGEVLVAGVLSGRHKVTVRRGRWFEDGVVYGTAEVEVVAGAEARLVLDADPGERRRKVHVTGTLLVPEAWGKWPNSVSIEGTDPGNTEVREYVRLKAPASGRLVAFELPELPEGRYRFEVHPLQWRRAVVVGADSALLDFDLGAPAEVAVKVVDADTGETPAGATVMWYTLLEDQHTWSPDRADAPGNDHEFLLRTPPGEVHVASDVPGYVDEHETVTASPGARVTATLRVKRGATLMVRLEIGDKPFAAPDPRVSISPQDDGQMSWVMKTVGTSGGLATIEGLAAGAYTVEALLGELPGWTSAEERVELKAGETKTVVLKVEKQP